MTLLYFDGFDLHNYVLTGFDVGGGSMQDAGYYWRGGTITRYLFPEGYRPPGGQAGRSFQVTSSGANQAGSIGVGGRRGRMGFWAKWNLARDLSIVRFRASTQYAVDFVSTPDGYLQLRVQGSLVTQSVITFDPSDWNYYEFFVDITSGEYYLKRNQIVLFNITNGPKYTGSSDASFSLGNASLSEAPAYRVDHLWVTDGAFPAGNEILGVQVAAAADKYQSNDDGFVGTLLIGGNRYETSFKGPVVQSQTGYGQGDNLANVLNYMFAADPSTGLPWTQSSYNMIQRWGLCYVPRGTPQTLRVAGVLLATLEYNGGRPIVTNRLVDGAGQFSGEWVRSDPDKSFAWHLGNVPRLDTPKVVGTPSLFVTGTGCALFSGPATPSVRPDFTDVGVTFAEEFREDYTDWVRIDGIGENFDSYFISGYGIYGEGNRKFQSNFVTVNYENVPTGGAFIQGLWDYTIDPDTGRWSMNQNIYKNEPGYKHGSRRLKIRGHGKTLQLRVSSKDGKPFKINGWTIMVSSNASV